MMNPPALELHDLTVSYAKKPVLYGVDVQVPQGALVGIIGPNGAGKSTMIRAIMGLTPLSGGWVQIFGESFEKSRHRVGYVPQREQVDWDFPVNVMDVVLMGRYGRRGWLRPGRVTLETRYPLCLVRAWSYVEPDMRCLVYPRPETAAPPLPLSARGESGGAHSGKGTEDFSGLRTHQPADSPRHVAWKAVAREQPLLTKQFAGASDAQVWLDWGELPPDLGIEARLSRLTRWLIDANAQGLAYGLSLPGKTVPLGQGARQFQDCLEALALHGD